MGTWRRALFKSLTTHPGRKPLYTPVLITTEPSQSAPTPGPRFLCSLTQIHSQLLVTQQSQDVQEFAPSPRYILSLWGLSVLSSSAFQQQLDT